MGYYFVYILNEIINFNNRKTGVGRFYISPLNSVTITIVNKKHKKQKSNGGFIYMVSKKLAARLAKKQDELKNAQAKITILKDEVADLKKQVELELVQKLQKHLQTEDLTDIEKFIEQVSPIKSQHDDKGGELNDN